MVNYLIFLIKSKVKVFQNAKYLDSLHYYGTFTICQDLEPKLLLAIRSNKIKHVLCIASYLKKNKKKYTTSYFLFFFRGMGEFEPLQLGN